MDQLSHHISNHKFMNFDVAKSNCFGIKVVLATDLKCETMNSLHRFWILFVVYFRDFLIN